MPVIRWAFLAALILLGQALAYGASEAPHSICEIVSPEKLAALYPSPLFPSEEKNGCRWSTSPNGKAYFQIGVIESDQRLRQFFEKQLPLNYQLKKIDDLGDRGLYTESRGYFSVIAVREGSWVLISTVDLLYIKPGDPRKPLLWDIYRETLKTLK